MMMMRGGRIQWGGEEKEGTRRGGNEGQSGAMKACNVARKCYEDIIEWLTILPFQRLSTNTHIPC